MRIGLEVAVPADVCIELDKMNQIPPRIHRLLARDEEDPAISALQNWLPEYSALW